MSFTNIYKAPPPLNVLSNVGRNAAQLFHVHSGAFRRMSR